MMPFLSCLSISEERPLTNVVDIPALFICKHHNVFTHTSGMYSNFATRTWISLCEPFAWVYSLSISDFLCLFVPHVISAKRTVFGSIVLAEENLPNSFSVMFGRFKINGEAFFIRSFRHCSYPNLLRFGVRFVISFRCIFSSRVLKLLKL